MASLDEFECGLGFTDTGLADDENAFAVNIDQYAVYGNAGCEFNVQPSDEFSHEYGCCLLCHVKRNAGFKGFFHEEFIGNQFTTENDTGNREA